MYERNQNKKQQRKQMRLLYCYKSMFFFKKCSICCWRWTRLTVHCQHEIHWLTCIKKYSVRRSLLITILLSSMPPKGSLLIIIKGNAMFQAARSSAFVFYTVWLCGFLWIASKVCSHTWQFVFCSVNQNVFLRKQICNANVGLYLRAIQLLGAVSLKLEPHWIFKLQYPKPG